jgi:hypothetical protein
MGVADAGEGGGDEGRSPDARARALAERAHRGQIEPSGLPLIDHVRRVASAVPPFARRVAWLHDVLEWTPLGEDALRSAGLGPDELAAVRLLTRAAGDAGDDGFLDHVRAIALAPGRPGRIARAVKRADLDDRLRHPRDPRAAWAPPYERAVRLLADAPDGSVGAGRGDPAKRWEDRR